MPRKFIKRLLPHHSEVKEHKYLKHLGQHLHDPNIWHLNRHSVSKAVAVGLFVMYIPLPLQMLLAAVIAIWLRVNLPIAVAVVWISNPLTMPAMFYAAYRLGAWIMGIPPQNLEFEISFEWLAQSLNGVMEPFLLGCFLTGTVLAVLGYFATQLFWRIMVMRSINRRKARSTSRSKKVK